jgi:hypothetical protein
MSRDGQLPRPADSKQHRFRGNEVFGDVEPLIIRGLTNRPAAACEVGVRASRCEELQFAVAAELADAHL